MYGASDDEDVKNQWEYLNGPANGYKCPWIVVGYLNFITRKEDKLGGNNPSRAVLDVVNNHLDFLNLNDIPFVGSPYTWSNRRNDVSLIMERLDIALGNDKWSEDYPNSVVYHLIPYGSDH